jgi:hypothetical protein
MSGEGSVNAVTAHAHAQVVAMCAQRRNLRNAMIAPFARLRSGHGCGLTRTPPEMVLGACAAPLLSEYQNREDVATKRRAKSRMRFVRTNLARSCRNTITM